MGMDTSCLEAPHVVIIGFKKSEYIDNCNIDIKIITKVDLAKLYMASFDSQEAKSVLTIMPQKCNT
jgi:hypothetical protein